VKTASLRRRLVGAITGLNALVLGIAFSALFLLQARQTRGDFLRRIRFFGEMTSEACLAPLLFNDAETAQAELGRLRAVPDVVAAQLLDRQQRSFSAFGELPESPWLASQANQISSLPGHFLYQHSIRFKGEECGRLTMLVSDGGMRTRNRQALAILMSALVLLLSFSLAMAFLIQRLLVRPLSELALLAERVTRDDRYDLRFPAANLKEFSPLVEAMNRMLNQIESRQLQRDSAESALRESEERFRSTFEQASLGLAHLDLAGHFLWFNRKMAELFGRSHKGLVGTPLPGYSQEPELWRSIIAKIAAGQLVEFSAEKPFQREGHAPFWGHLSLSLVCDGAGDARYLVAAMEDLSRSRQLEEELHQARKLDSLGRLAGGIAHDFNNILTVIRGYCDLYEASGKEHNSEIKPIAMAAERAMALTRQLLAFGRKQLLQTKTFDLNQLLRGLEPLLLPLIREDIQLSWQLCSHPCPVRSDPGQLEQVVINLVVNARDALPKGGTILLRTLTEDHWPSDDPPPLPAHGSGWVMLEVCDDGIGMSEEVRAQVFEPFFTTKAVGKGTGLGLASAHGVIQQCGGMIRVRSEPGKGSRFQIFLPREPQCDERERAPAREGQRKGKGQRILLVEDQGELREMLEQTLSWAGYRPKSAANGFTAWELLLQDSYDLVVSDIVMPKMNGFELYQRLRDHGLNTPFLFMSGYPDDPQFMENVVACRLPYLSKPFTTEAFLNTIAELLLQRPPA